MLIKLQLFCFHVTAVYHVTVLYHVIVVYHVTAVYLVVILLPFNALQNTQHES